MLVGSILSCEDPSVEDYNYESGNYDDSGYDGLDYYVERPDGTTAEGGDCVWVHSYYRSDGTCVRGHWRSAPDRDCSLVGTEYVGCQ